MERISRFRAVLFLALFAFVLVLFASRLFVLTAAFSCLVLIPLYSLIYKIGLIGGNTWKE